MKLDFEFTKEDITKIKADIFIIECRKMPGEKKKPGQLLRTDGGAALDKKLGGLIGRIITEEGLTGEAGCYKVIQTHGKIGAKNILVAGIGEDREFDLDTVRIVGARISKVAGELKASSVAGVVQPEKVEKFTPAERMQALSEGLILGGYRFERYKDKKAIEKQTFKTIKLICRGDTAPLSKAIATGTTIAEAINYARDLVNTPGDDMTPEVVAKEALKIGKKKGLSCTILDEKGIKRERMNLISAISKGSANPPRFIHIKYTPPRKAGARIAIVGKGITFDSGGYHLKPIKHIENMKCDMAGAAAVLAVMKMLPSFKPNVAVDGIIAASENMIDGKSIKPGDVIISRSGKTIEISNVDAEGRLIIADAIDYALQKKPDMLIDIATLTGGVLYALGEIYTAILGNDQKLIDKLISASKEGGEPTWQLPLEKKYLKGLKEAIADLNNTGKTYAIVISGALFLSEFVGKTRWAHLDIAESAWAKEERDYHPKGGTGAGAQTLIRFLMKY